MGFRFFRTSGLTCPFIFAAAVPGRAEYVKTCPPANSISRTKSKRLGKFVLRLAGEARDDIGRDGNLRHDFSRRGDQLTERLGRGLARHPFQHGLGTRLQRQVQMWHEAGIFPERKKSASKSQGSSEESRKRGVSVSRENRSDQFAQMTSMLLPPRTEMHTRQHDFFCAARQRELNILESHPPADASALPARDGGDAERAGIVAPILHFDEGPRATMKARQGLAA